MPQKRSAALWKPGDLECATGSPITASRTGGSKPANLPGFEMKSSAEKISGTLVCMPKESRQAIRWQAG
jgi:hypothetical protein